jgi:hypothetical protein
MAKELPFFKFEPNLWDNGNIQMLSRNDKGLFIDLCCMYWSRIGNVPIKLAIQKLCAGNALALNPLCDEKIIEIIDGNIYIKFLSEQLLEFNNTSEQNSKNAKERWEKLRKQRDECERNASASNPQCESDAIREDKIREDKRREEKKKGIITASPFSFYETLISFGGEKQLVSEWLKVRKTKKATNTETALKRFMKEVNLTNADINQILELCIEKSWSGYNSEWFEKEKKPSQKNNPLFGRQTEEVLKANLKGWQ